MKGKYNCAQAVFIVLVDTVLNSMTEYLALLKEAIPKYDQTWIDNLRAMLTAAIALPTEEEAQAVSSLIGVKLSDQNVVCCSLWQTLARRIKGAYPANEVKIQLTAAGQSKYETAVRGNWADGKSMLDSAKKFLAANLEKLTANGNMNPAFATEFTDAAALFNTHLSDYQSSKEAVGVANQNRVKAFNDIFDALMPMMLDAQDIFQNDEAVRTQFVYTHVLERISGPGLAGARGTVTNSSSLLPIEGATVEMWLASNPAIIYTVNTDIEGKYLIHSPSGDYKLRVTAAAYVPSEIKDISIAVGTVSAFNQQLVAAAG